MKQIELFDNKINVKRLILDQVLHLKNWKFIDLFAGIGGIRIPFSELGAECVFTSEWDKYAQQTYLQNYGQQPEGDITQINEAEILN